MKDKYSCETFITSVYDPFFLYTATGVVGVCPGNSAAWGAWQDSDDPNGQGDFERRPNTTCSNPVGIQARTVSSKKPYTSTGDIVTISLQTGLLCRNDANTGACTDYEVRFCCRVGELTMINETQVFRSLQHSMLSFYSNQVK